MIATTHQQAIFYYGNQIPEYRARHWVTPERQILGSFDDSPIILCPVPVK
jgi:hypothetical protein